MDVFTEVIYIKDLPDVKYILRYLVSRSDGLKVLNARLDPQVIEKFDDFCGRHPTESKQWLIEFALDYTSKLSDSDFRRLYEPFYQWRSMRKREIKLEMAKQRDDGKGKK